MLQNVWRVRLLQYCCCSLLSCLQKIHTGRISSNDDISSFTNLHGLWINNISTITMNRI
jgi:hypothetical protein